jgi:hypothetical protein
MIVVTMEAVHVSRAPVHLALPSAHGHRTRPLAGRTVWWRCHRRIITDHLLAAGERVFHILGPGHIEPAVMNAAARISADGALVYPAEPLAQRDLFDRAR